MSEDNQNTREDRKDNRNQKQVNVRDFGSEGGEKSNRRSSSTRRSKNKRYSDRRRKKDSYSKDDRDGQRKQSSREDAKDRPEGESGKSRSSRRRRKPSNRKPSYNQDKSQGKRDVQVTEKSGETAAKPSRDEQKIREEQQRNIPARQERGRGEEVERSAQPNRGKKKKSWSEYTVEELRSENERLEEEIQRQIEKFREYHL